MANTITEQPITSLPNKNAYQVVSSDKLLGIDSREGYQILVNEFSNYVLENGVITSTDGTKSIMTIINELLSQINALKTLAVGPKAASTVAEMTDTASVYVYTGNETGYTKGNWYYYDDDNETWLSGGIYNATAVETDKTLTTADMPADAKAVGDQLSIIREAKYA